MLLRCVPMSVFHNYNDKKKTYIFMLFLSTIIKWHKMHVRGKYVYMVKWLFVVRTHKKYIEHVKCIVQNSFI